MSKTRMRNEVPPAHPFRVHTEKAPQGTVSYYKLHSVLCLYAANASNGGVELSMLHKVDSLGKLKSGAPVDPVAFASSIHRLKKGEIISKLVLVGDNVLAENKDAVLWWRPASVAPIWFKTADPVPALTALNGKPLPHPPLLFKASKNGRNLQVWALLQNKRPTADTPLYHAPYMNLSPSPHVCMGSARSKELTDLKKGTPADWEHLFFDSNFSHTPPPLHHASLRKTPPPAGTLDERKEKLEAYAAFLASLSKTRSNQSSAAFKHALVRYKDHTLSAVL